MLTKDGGGEQSTREDASVPAPAWNSTLTSPEARREGRQWHQSGERRDTTLTRRPPPPLLPFYSPGLPIVSASVPAPLEHT